MNGADRLLNKIDEMENPCVIGLDPRIESIPDFIKKPNLEKYGDTKEAVAKSFFDFNKLIINETKDVVPAYKPQNAFYEKYGPKGVQAFEDTVRYIKKVGRIAIEDGKRNDIGSTAEAYSDGHIGKVELISGELVPGFDLDYITVNPYLGIDGVKPFVEDSKKYGNGIFVLDKTSNESAGDLQDKIVFLDEWQIKLVKERLDGTGLKISDLPQMKNFYSLGQKNLYNIDATGIIGVAPNYVLMAANIEKWGEETEGETEYRPIGAVIGATYPEEARILRKIMPKNVNLIPGYGAQGGGAKDALPNFNEDGYGGIVNNSRGIIFAYLKEPYKNKYPPEEFDRASRESALDMKEDIASAMKEIGIWRY